MMSGKDTWEFKTFQSNYSHLRLALSDYSGTAKRLSNKLFEEKIIGRDLKDEIIAHGLSEIDRVHQILDVMLSKIKQNAKLYDTFREILLAPEVDVDPAIVNSILQGT